MIFWTQKRAPRPKTSLRQIAVALIGLLIGYPLFAFAGYWIMQLLSGNNFDGSIEASMIAVFAIGSLGAVVGLVVGMIAGGMKRKAVPQAADKI